MKKKSITIGKKVKLRFVKDRPGHDYRYALNSKKIFKHLGWKTNFMKCWSRKGFSAQPVKF